MKIAFLTVRNSNSASNVTQFIDGIKIYSLHQFIEINPQHDGFFDFNPEHFDGICIHYTSIHFPMRIWKPFSLELRQKIAQFKGIKLAFIQDEQRALNDRLNFLNQLGVHHLLSVSPQKNLDLLYPPQSRCFNVHNILTGYVRQDLVNVNLDIHNRRSIDVFYRGRKLPNWFDSTSHQKHTVHKRLGSELKKMGLKINSSSAEIMRVYGSLWDTFLYNSKASLLTPSGSGVIDMDGRYLEKWVKPDILKLTHQAPLVIDNFMLSPRLFEYANWGCLIISTFFIDLPEIKAFEDYFLLEDDYSNMGALYQLLQNDRERIRITSNARHKLILSENYSITNLTNLVDTLIFEYHNVNFNMKIRKNQMPISELVTKLDHTNRQIFFLILMKCNFNSLINLVIGFVNLFNGSVRKLNRFCKFVMFQ